MDMAPSFPPSPSPVSSSQGPSIEDNTDIVKALVILAVVGMFFLHVLGSLRRQASHGLLHGIVMKIDILSYPLVGFTIGKMDHSNLYYKDFAVWAVFLLLLLGSTVSLSAFRLDDIDGWKGVYLKHLFKVVMVVVIILEIRFLWRPKGMKYLWRPLAAILLVGVVKGYVRIASLRTASQPYLCKNLKRMDEDMKHDDDLPVRFDPVTMQGYQYMVAGEKCRAKRPRCTPRCTTVEQIWQCQGNLLLHERGMLLKDLCLSMALCKMLNRRFAGVRISEADREKTHDLVFKGLLAGDKADERAFRVVEEELVFVHDTYYTSYSYLYQKGRYLALCLPAIMFGLCSWLTVLLVADTREAKKQPDDISCLDITIFLTAILASLEAYQLYLYIASGWFKVALIETYVSTPFFQSCPFEMIISLLMWLKAFRPWKETLGQYCLLGELGRQSQFRNCLHYATLRLVDKGKKRGRQSSVKLSKNVKKAIVDTLLGSNGHLTSGARSLKNNGVLDRLSSWAFDDVGTDGTVTRTILVWHIATTLCWQQLDEQHRKEDAVITASNLSKYCLYLLAFAPHLLPDHSSTSEHILDQAIDEADRLLKKHKKLDERCTRLKEYSGDEAPLLTQGAQLASHLINDIQEPAQRWKVLSDFWAELMLYVSPSDDARAHLEVLAKGGEFITHLWALLTHAGVLKRRSAYPSDDV